MDDQILTLYAKGLSTRKIVAAFKEMYDADMSATLISRVTDRVLEEITQWQSRPLGAIYPIVYLDCIVIKIRDNLRVINKAIYLAIEQASKKWTMPIQNWRMALNRFVIEFGDRLNGHQ